MVTERPAEVLHGRRVEREVLERLLEAVRGGQSRNEPSVEPARIQAGDSAGGISSQTVGDDPFAVEFRRSLIDVYLADKSRRAKNFHLFS